ncbi:MAG: tRNA (5-methylaminomethyl-2-thiouridine)(34)-methyltransferase MnmD [Chitinophagaceae bacterium]|nr:tRNA (5-methylaminomethyl-2-thiouridine)(34)-methyltransferase MnmD [Chitinophagaceae bacterium]
MQRQIIITSDGSHSVAIPELNVTYHSIHGAIQESLHVFIKAGLLFESERLQLSEPYSILEIGFGTGLNALLTLIETQKQKNLEIHYTALELFPLHKEEYTQLNYCEALKEPAMQEYFGKMHECEWEKDVRIAERFTLHKANQSLPGFKPIRLFNVVYFDAFAPSAQPELWTKEIFELLYSSMSTQSVLVTYCSKGDVRRAMIAAGFIVEKIPGPPHKREMLRAIRK